MSDAFRHHQAIVPSIRLGGRMWRAGVKRYSAGPSLYLWAMLRPMSSFWDNANHVHRLRELLEAEFSSSAAAAALSVETGHTVTKDAVKTKARALGLELRGKGGRPVGSKAESAPRSPRAPIVRISGFVRFALPLPIDELRTLPPQSDPLPFISLPESSCAWPVSGWLEEGTAQTPCCGAPSVDGSRYCGPHRRLAYLPGSARAGERAA